MKNQILLTLAASAIAMAVAAVAQDSGGDRDAMIEEGREVFMARCEYCHGTGVQKGATMTLGRRYQGAVPGALAERTNLTGEYIRAIVRTNTSGMAPIRITEVSDEQLDALIVFLTRNNP